MVQEQERCQCCEHDDCVDNFDDIFVDLIAFDSRSRMQDLLGDLHVVRRENSISPILDDGFNAAMHIVLGGHFKNGDPIACTVRGSSRLQSSEGMQDRCC
jgi:hypothetical protein